MIPIRTMMAIFLGILVVGMSLYVYAMQTPWANEQFVDAGGCGPGRGVCTGGLRCINGYCKSDVAPKLPALSDLPVRPERYPYPVPNPAPNVTGTCGIVV